MKISAEISMYPLNPNYETPILNFIRDLNTHEGIEVKTNGMSTQVFGEYDLVMDALKNDIKIAFAKGDKISMVFKILNMDVSTPNQDISS